MADKKPDEMPNTAYTNDEMVLWEQALIASIANPALNTLDGIYRANATIEACREMREQQRSLKDKEDTDFLESLQNNTGEPRKVNL